MTGSTHMFAKTKMIESKAKNVISLPRLLTVISVTVKRAYARWRMMMNRTTLNKNDLKILEQYSQAIYGCGWNDLDNKEQTMLIGYCQERCPEFMYHFGVVV